MATTAVQITLSEMQRFLRPENGWTEAQPGFKCEEHVFDWSPCADRPEMVVRVYTSVKSVAVGYGPVCAEKFGLPWGAVPKEVA